RTSDCLKSWKWRTANSPLPASTRASSSQTCPMSCEHRSTRSSGSRRCCRNVCLAISTRSRKSISKTSTPRARICCPMINDILDLSKIEAGRMELELTDFHLPTALDSALTLVRERAGRRAIAMHTNIDGQLGEIRADERKIRQVVLNLLS